MWIVSRQCRVIAESLHPRCIIQKRQNGEQSIGGEQKLMLLEPDDRMNIGGMITQNLKSERASV